MRAVDAGQEPLTHRVIGPTLRLVNLDVAIAFVAASALGVSLLLAIVRRALR